MIVTPSSFADRIERRGNEGVLEGEITIVDDCGVLIRVASGVEHLVPWDRVRSVDAKVNDPAIEHGLKDAEPLWRARSRVQRGDTTLAEPLFERLFEKYRGRTHETALVVAEGLLRCRLDRAAYDEALLPYLETVRLIRAKVTTDSYSMLEPVLDEPTGLCPQLAPVWAPSQVLPRLYRELGEYDSKNDAVVLALARLYQISMAVQLGQPSELLVNSSDKANEHRGVQYLTLLVESISETKNIRAAARDNLQRRLKQFTPWQQAWAQFMLGLSWLSESGMGRQQRGLLRLTYIPALYDYDQPYLAGLALAYVAQGLETLGRNEQAGRIRVELQRHYPDHPVLSLMKTELHAILTAALNRNSS